MFIDLTGQRFSKLVVIKKFGYRYRGRVFLWLCKCDCGKTTKVITASLKSGHTKSCGCLYRREMKDKRFGNWLVLKEQGRDKNNGNILWLCQCVCGTIRTVDGGSLRRGDSTSCGCTSTAITHGYCRKSASQHDRIRLRAWKKAKQRAKQEGVSFELKLEEVPNIPEFCPVFPWIKLDLNSRGWDDNHPSLDRLIPEKGYVLGNINYISMAANTLKSNGTFKEFQKIVSYLQKHGVTE